MSKKIKVEVEEINRLKGLLNDFNALDLKDVDLYENGKKIEIQDSLKDWKYTGLCNHDFVMNRYWED